ncbi:MAG: glycosyltransferase family 2 protein [Bacteroidales bacterium]|jgi:GT2 family glycosyltransferase|nr:glycosyltransferase family 2 protein [Bacteroidales bacterium]
MDKTTIKTLNLPLVSIITVNYNQSGVTLDFLASMQACTYPNYEIFVVDNASPNDNPDIIKKNYPAVHLIKTAVNLGFAGGNNVAVDQAKGKYLLFINNDTEVEPGFLEPLVELLENNPDIGMVSPKIHYFHTPNTFQYAGFSPIHPITIRNYALGFGEKDTGQYNHTVQTGSIFGAAMLVPMKVIEEVGKMSEIFFLYYEEHDWAARIEKAGYKVYFDGRSLVKHKESISTIKESPFQIYYINRGRILFARRNNRGFVKLLSMLFLYSISLPKISFKYLLKGRSDLAAATLKSAWWNMTNPSEINKQTNE